MYHINHSKQFYGLLQQAYQPIGCSMGFLSPLLLCKFLNNWEKNFRHNAASAEKKKTECVKYLPHLIVHLNIICVNFKQVFINISMIFV